MEGASAELKKVSRMDVVYEYSKWQCAPECQGSWFECATQVLDQNGVEPVEFASSVRELLTNARGKNRNLFITGPTNCGKTFLLKPLQTMFNTFSNPANDKYAFVGIADADIMFLNDFQWDREMIPWRDLLLLEGQPVHFPMPKNHYKDDIYLTRDTPIFATGKAVTTFKGPYNARDPTEDEMMVS
ncbi:uncharacterized protein LOC110251424 [Paramuricea clavata]|uniref:Uncharacterized protein LOC110251424, partial n=1 Tax=Paramuricea clavata TaxID=317549 RepID=A0A7D9ES71_PARCT|nr:uncharacterized protein LOC110251424 [Paramuricea clavata]